MRRRRLHGVSPRLGFNRCLGSRNSRLLDPLDPLFAKVAKMFLEEQTRRFGADHLYAADPFIETVPPSRDLKYLADVSRAIYNGMAQSHPKAVWVLQGWAFIHQGEFDAAANEGLFRRHCRRTEWSCSISSAS